MASRTHLAAKGFVQIQPVGQLHRHGPQGQVEATIQRHYGGTAHPVNSPFDYSFVKHPAGGDSLLPNASDTTGRGYIVTGFNKADGLSRCVIDELPTGRSSRSANWSTGTCATKTRSRPSPST